MNEERLEINHDFKLESFNEIERKHLEINYEMSAKMLNKIKEKYIRIFKHKYNLDDDDIRILLDITYRCDDGVSPLKIEKE